MLLAVGVLVLVVVGGGAIFVFTYTPDQRPASKIDIDIQPEMITRGEYLVNHVLACPECHSDRDWTRYGGPITGPPLTGGGCWGPETQMPGKVCLPNITDDDEAGIGVWTDGELMRAIREGVDSDGNAIFPVMPYGSYRHLSDEDTQAVVAFLRRGVEESDRADQTSEIEFPASFFIKMAPVPLEGPVSGPKESDGVAYGEYLATVAGCVFCHTPVNDRRRMKKDKLLAGGQEFRGPWGTVRTANLTPHETGMTMPREGFIDLFKAFEDPRSWSRVDPRNNTVMPWISYAGMSRSDLGMIYDYLQSVPAIEHEVERRPSTQKVVDALGQAP